MHCHRRKSDPAYERWRRENATRRGCHSQYSASSCIISIYKLVELVKRFGTGQV